MSACSGSLLLILGPTGSGKTTLIRELERLDHRFVYIRPYTTRMLRPGETDKVHVSKEQMDALWKNGDLVVVNELYGVNYGTPRAPIQEAFDAGAFPMIDWPVTHIQRLAAEYQNRVYTVYVRPPDYVTLADRLSGRNNFADRLAIAQDELRRFEGHEYDDLIDYVVVSDQDGLARGAEAVYKAYLGLMCAPKGEV